MHVRCHFGSRQQCFRQLLFRGSKMGSWQQLLGRAWNSIMFSMSPGQRKSTSGEAVVPRSQEPVTSRAERPRMVRSRSAYNVHEQVELGIEAAGFREDFFERKGTTYGWLQPFLAERFDLGEAMGKASRMAYNQVRLAVRCIEGGRDKAKGSKGEATAQLVFESE